MAEAQKNLQEPVDLKLVLDWCISTAHGRTISEQFHRAVSAFLTARFEACKAINPDMAGVLNILLEECTAAHAECPLCQKWRTLHQVHPKSGSPLACESCIEGAAERLEEQRRV